MYLLCDHVLVPKLYCEWPTMPYVGWCLFTWYSYPITGLDMHLGQREVEAPKFHDTQHMNMVRLSSQCTHHL